MPASFADVMWCTQPDGLTMSQGKVTDEPTMIFLLFVVTTGVVCYGLWYVWHDYFLEALRYFRLFELFIINIFTLGKYSNLVQDISPGWMGGPEGNVFTLQKFFLITGIVGYFVRWPIAVIIFCTGIYFLFFSKRGKFKKQHDLESLIKVQAKIWPVITPIVNFNPGKLSARAAGDPVPEKLPIFAEALSPEEWLAFHNIKLVNGLPEREAVRKALIAQLGPRWNGHESLPPYLRALFAAFALKGMQQRNESDDLLSEIAVCWSLNSGFHMPIALAKKIDAILGNPDLVGKAETIASLHAYRTTAMLGVLRWGRNMGGVLAPATFLWLRGHDRETWYPFNNLGRRSYHAEAAGAMAHFMAEQAAKKPLPIPRIDTALITINRYLADHQVVLPPRGSDAPRKKAYT